MTQATRPPRNYKPWWLRRRALVVFAAWMLVGFAFLSPGRASAKTPNCFEVGFQQACIDSFDFDFTDTELCDFPVQVQGSEVIRYRPFFAKDGSFIGEEVHYRARATVVNPTTGRSFRDMSSYSERAAVLPDGSIDVLATGIFHSVRLDDGQRLFHQSGNHSILLDVDEQLIDETFRGNFQSEQAFREEICPILAQPS